MLRGLARDSQWRPAPLQRIRQVQPKLSAHVLKGAAPASPLVCLLQDFIRQVCKPAYTNVFRDRDGELEGWS